MEPAIALQNPLVRDLAWALSSPPLLQRHDPGLHWPDVDWFTEISGNYRKRLAQLDRDPRALAELVARQADHRLGNYFETLWRFWLNDNPRYRLLHANLPVRTSQRTIGEFDFLVSDLETGRTLHWEIAVKFYLGTGDTTRPDNWWGPGRRDRLDIKTGHLLQHQSRLSGHPAARRLLDSLDLHVDETWVIIKGRLFYPAGEHTEAPAGAHPRHLKGFWTRQAALSSCHRGSWRELERRQWLAPLQADTTTGPDNTAPAHTLRHMLLRHPSCVACVGEDGEMERGFIVADDWGQTTST